MDPAALRARQAPLKTRYREDPGQARVTSRAVGTLRPETLSVTVIPTPGPVDAGLHPATGGDGSLRCSGDMLLEALVACAGVTLLAVATSMGISIRGGEVTAEGDWDARGTLAVNREVPVGLTAVRVGVRLQSAATPEQLAKLLTLTERYCVVAQTLRAAVPVEIRSVS